MSAPENTRKLRNLFTECTNEVNLRGVFGATRYRPVFDDLMPVQQERLREIVGDQHEYLMEKGFIVNFAYAYPEGVIDNIGQVRDGVFDKEAWNIYARWYETLNNSLNVTSLRLAESINGIPLPATSEGMAAVVETVKDYFPTVVSHRVHAEHSGIGWRGKNSLIVNPVYSCMIRLAGVITAEPVITTTRLDDNCGSCDSCLQACTFLKHMDRLEEYRQQCLNYMNWLDLYEEVCGKCIKACVHSPKFTQKTTPPQSSNLDQLFYTFPTSAR